MFKDYYKILNITCPSSADEIKTAYRQQAMRWHPDRNQGRDTTSEMQEVVEAYYVLGNPERKARYDAEYRLYQAAHIQRTASSDYQVHDQYVRQDMASARQEASDYMREFLDSLKQNGKIAAQGAWEELKKWLFILLVFIILGMIVSLCMGNSVNESLY
ncbi:MAG: DnaJ domain-containing protein [Bacteroidales bacterium]|nr:DnaJ domain-containing protein [Bacteroidales bacterium]